MSCPKPPLLTIVFVWIAVATATCARPASAIEPSQRIGPTTEPLIRLPFGLQWTHSPWEAVQVVKQVPGVHEVLWHDHDLTTLTSAELRELLTRDLHARTYEHWDEPIAENLMTVTVRPMMIQRVACELTLVWRPNRGLIVIDPDRVIRARAKGEDGTMCDDALWPLLLAHACIRNLPDEKVPAEVVRAVQQSMFQRHRPVIQAAWERRLADEHLKIADPKLQAVNERVIQSRNYQTFVSNHLAYLLAESESQQKTLAQQRDRAFTPLRDWIWSLGCDFPRWTEGVNWMAKAGMVWFPDGRVANFFLDFEDGVVWFRCAAGASGSRASNHLSIEYQRTPGYFNMLDEAQQAFERQAREQADVQLRDSRKKLPDLLDGL